MIILCKINYSNNSKDVKSYENSSHKVSCEFSAGDNRCSFSGRFAIAIHNCASQNGRVSFFSEFLAVSSNDYSYLRHRHWEWRDRIASENGSLELPCGVNGNLAANFIPNT